MSPYRPYPPKAAEPAPTAAHRAIVRHLRSRSTALSVQEVEYLVSFLALAGEAAGASDLGEPAAANAWCREIL